MIVSLVTTLSDGLNHYRTCSISDWNRTVRIERAAIGVARLILESGSNPNPALLRAAYDLLLDIEEWKAMCLQERMGNAGQNSEQTVWNAFRGALNADNDRDSILSIMQLKGFGSTRDDQTGQRGAKVASAALRFLMPDSWGVVDWRTAAMLEFLDRSKGDVDQAMLLAKKWKADDLRETYRHINEDWACEINRKYRERRTTPSFPRTADVEMAVFGLSMMVWPFR